MCQKRGDLFKIITNIFKNDNSKISKNVCDNKSIKINLKIIIPDDEETPISLKLSRKEKLYN